MKTDLKVAHKAEGNIVQNDVVNDELYEILKKLPRPLPAMKLTRGQKKWWVWFGVELVKTKQVSKLDLMHLQQAAFWMDVRCQAYDEIKTKGYNSGMVQTFMSGATNVSPHVTLVEKADKHLADVSAHFGFSIKDRSKLKPKEMQPENQLSLFEQVQKALHG